MCCSEKCQIVIPFCLHYTMETPYGNWIFFIATHL
jgi:hypothetical protein